MKYVFKQVFSACLFCFLLSLRNNLFTCPAVLLLPFCFISPFRPAISPLALVAILFYIHTYTLIPALVLPNQATLH